MLSEDQLLRLVDHLIERVNRLEQTVASHISTRSDTRGITSIDTAISLLERAVTAQERSAAECRALTVEYRKQNKL